MQADIFYLFPKAPEKPYYSKPIHEIYSVKTVGERGIEPRPYAPHAQILPVNYSPPTDLPFYILLQPLST